MDGNVGIGTTSPIEKLDISGVTITQGLQVTSTVINNNNLSRPAIATRSSTVGIKDYEIAAIPHYYSSRTSNYTADNGFLRIRVGGGTNATTTSYIDLTGYAASGYTDMNQNIVFGTSGTEKMRILSNGNVGIGNSTPEYLIDLADSAMVGNASPPAKYIRFITHNISGNSSGGLIWKTNYGGTYTKISAKIEAICENDYFRQGLAFFTGNHSSATTDTTEKMRIDMDGNVGIGTTNPAYKLELAGSGQSWTTAPIIHFNDTYNTKSWLMGNANAISAGDFYIRKSSSTLQGIRITQGGAMYVYGNVFQPSTSLGSDDRLKHNEKDITSALETINKLKVQRYFKTNTLYDASHQFELDNSGNPITDEEYYDEIGIIAQDIKKIPELAFCVGGKEEEEKIKTHYKKDVSGNFILDVSGNKIVDFEETINIKTPLYLNYNNIFCYHIQATQELDKQQQADKLKIQTLETTIQQQATKITTLETQIADILTRLSNLENSN